MEHFTASLRERYETALQGLCGAESAMIRSDVAMWAAWGVLGVALASFVIQRKDMPFRPLGWLIAFAMMACATVRTAEIALPAGLAAHVVAMAKSASSVVCWLAVIGVWRAIPRALSLPNPSRMNDLLQIEIRERERANERSRLVFDLAPNAIVMANQNGRIIQVNAQTEQCFGYSRADLIGQVLDVLVPQRFRDPRSPDPFSSRAAERTPGGRSVGELFGLRRDGSEFPVEVGVQPIVTDRDLLVLIVLVDVTPQKRAEAALKKLADDLQRSNSDLAQFAYVASHDLKEPLRKVSSFCQLLKEQYEGQLDEHAQRYIDYAVDGSRRMNDLITALLELAQISSRATSAVPTDTAAACRTAIENLASAIEETGATVECGELPVVLGEETHLAQLFQNLIGNAIKFRGTNRPVISIDARLQEGAWLFAVRDNGIGIDPAQHERVFRIFQRLHSREEYPGTGIGLAICQKIVERHGGRIWIESTPGQGTTFYLTLPPAPRDKELDRERGVLCHAH